MTARTEILARIAAPGSHYQAELIRQELHDDFQRAGLKVGRLKSRRDELKHLPLQNGETFDGRLYRLDMLKVEIDAAGMERQQAQERLQAHEEVMAATFPS